MQEDFLTRIRSSYNQFTKAEKRVADFILQNPNRVLFMSISDLAETCMVGDTSVFRFCKTMNLKGYQEFKMTLSLSMRGNKNLEIRLRTLQIRYYRIPFLPSGKVIHFWTSHRSAWLWRRFPRRNEFCFSV